MILCPNGHPNQEDADFCTVCHAYLGWDREPAPPAPPPPPPDQPPARAGVVGSVEPPEVVVPPGQEATARLRVRNTGGLVDQYAFQVEGPAAGWTGVDPMTLSLLPGQEGAAQLRFLPPGSPAPPAGPVPFTVRIVSRADLEASVTVQGTVQVAPAGGVSATLMPQTSRARFMARHTLTLTNGGNTPVNAALSASDPDGQLSFMVSPSAVDPAPGARAEASIRVRARGVMFLGQDTPRPFTVTARPDGGEPVTADGTMVQLPLAPKWVLAAVPVVIAALAFLGVKVVGDGGPAQLAVVPAVQGLGQAEAVERLRAAGFEVEVRGVPNDATPGQVVSTAPPAGQSAEEGSTVVVFVSEGPGATSGTAVEIPDLARSSIDDARVVLEGLGLVVEVREQPDDGIDPGQVIGTDPPAGEQVERGSTVRVLASTGPAQPLPDLQLSLEPGCQIVGRGGLSGQDVINFFFRARSVGEVPYEGSVRATATGDSGLFGQSVTAVSTGAASSVVQVEVGPQEYGRTHTFTIVVEATDSIDEADDSNNGATVDVPLPDAVPSPGEVIDPCS